MLTKLIVLLFALCMAFNATAQQTTCDSLYIKVAGMKQNQWGKKTIDLNIDLIPNIKYIYLSSSAYQIVHFTIGNNSTGSYMETINKGPLLSPASLAHLAYCKKGVKIFITEFILSSPGKPDFKCKDLYLHIQLH